MTSREELETAVRVQICCRTLIRTTHDGKSIQTRWCVVPDLCGHCAELLTTILAAADAHVERVIGEDEDYRKLKPCKLCGAAYQYRCSCADAVNTRLTEQRQRAGLEANHGA